jgi:membrane associated rhomboid family serine protease
MKNNLLKLKLVFVPFVIISIVLIVGYTFLNWLLLIKLKLFSVNEDIVNFWIPIALPWVPIILWLKARIKILNLKSENGNQPFLYMFVAWLAMIGPIVISQFYIESASGTLTRLTAITNIKGTDTKYYSLNRYYIDKVNATTHSEFEVSGKHNEDFNMRIYVAVPIFAQVADTAGNECIAWYGVKYSQQISNDLSSSDKETKYRAFVKESEADFEKKDVSKFVYLERIGNIDDHKAYNTAISNSNKYLNKSTTMLLPINEPFEARNGSKQAWILGLLIIAAIVWLFMVLFPEVDEEALAAYKSGNKNEEKEDTIWWVLVPKQGYFITPIIVNLNLLLFIIMVCAGLGFLSFKAPDLLRWGGNYRPAIMIGEWWRLLTNIFIHGGLMHLLCNMYGLLFAGLFLEPLLGKIRYAAIYLLTGIAASLTSLWWHEAIVSVGASGAIFGLYGFFLALLLLRVFPKGFSKAFLLSTIVFVGYNLLMGLAGGIDNAAHIGGLVTGFVIGAAMYPKLKKQIENDMQNANEVNATENLIEDAETENGIVKK